MSLDVSLVIDDRIKRPAGSGIFIRENGKTIEISEAEWNKRNPGRDPVRFQNLDDETNEVYSANITHNLTRMADEVGIYYALWRPEERGWQHAHSLIKPLEAGLKELKANPNTYKLLNPENGWGDYDGLVEFVENYLAACKQYPNAKIEVSR
jgi:hypothetical protein